MRSFRNFQVEGNYTLNEYKYIRGKWRRTEMTFILTNKKEREVVDFIRNWVPRGILNVDVNKGEVTAIHCGGFRYKVVRSGFKERLIRHYLYSAGSEVRRTNRILSRGKKRWISKGI